MKFYISYTDSSGCCSETSGYYVFCDDVSEVFEKAKQIFDISNIQYEQISIIINQQTEGTRERKKKDV